MYRFVLMFTMVFGLASEAGAQKEAWNYSTRVPPTFIQELNGALAASGSKGYFTFILSAHGIETEKGVERVFVPWATSAMQCRGERFGVASDFIIPAQPELPAAKKESMLLAGWKPMGAARTIAFLTSTYPGSASLQKLAVPMVRMMNEICERGTEDPAFIALTLWHKTSRDSHIPGYSMETDITLTYSSVSTKRWNQLISER